MRVYIETFGCRANHYDSERVRALAIQGRHEIVNAVEDADVAVFNSCAVTAEAERDLRKAVRRAVKRNARVRSIVMGCASALPASQDVLRALPSVDGLIAGADLDAVAELFGVANAGVGGLQTTARATLRVQDGCDEHCTFCATTLARGSNRSRNAEELVREAMLLAEAHPEIVITGTHIGAYGADIGSSLGALMRRLVRDVPIVRFRLSSVEASEVDDALVELLAAGDGRVAPHLHAPLQSGSDRILKRMGRHWYTAELYAQRVERLAKRLPVFGLGADIIVAFPGESEEDYLATVAMVERLPFTYLHVFTYSPRAGTAATRLPGHVPLSAAQQRSHHVRHLGQKKGKEYRATRAGGPADIVVVSAGAEREGLTEDYLTVKIDGAARPRGTRYPATLRMDGEALVAV